MSPSLAMLAGAIGLAAFAETMPQGAPRSELLIKPRSAERDAEKLAAAESKRARRNAKRAGRG